MPMWGVRARGPRGRRRYGTANVPLWKNTRGGPSGGGLVIFGIDHEATAHAFAFAFGVQVGFVAKGEVDDATLARRHRAEVIWRAGLANFFGGDSGGHPEFLNALCALAVAIEGNLFMFAGRQAKHFERDQFKGAEKFSSTVEQESRVGAGKIHEDLGLFPIPILGQRWIDDDAILKAKTAVVDDGLEEFVDLFGGGDFVGNGHRIQLSAISRRLLGRAWNQVTPGAKALI